ncbi:DUF1232 domain-containing protein [Streptomyces sp. LBUM 1485]|nr:DUF1232 domain-containing protein [Streptomyces sp. LBUM 1485]
MDSWTWGVIAAIVLIAAAVLGVAVWLLLRLVRTRRELNRAGLPTGPKWVFWGAVLYLVLPTDLVPDPVYLDDIGVLLLAIRSMRSGRQDALDAMERQEGTGTAVRDEALSG